MPEFANEVCVLFDINQLAALDDVSLHRCAILYGRCAHIDSTKCLLCP